MRKVRNSRFPMSLFWTVYGILLATVGVHIGIILLGETLAWSSILMSHLILFYWAAVSVLIVLFIRHKMHKAYEIPLQEISRATAKVAKGDFSVYIPTTHPAETYDYLDIMITDINTMIEELGSIETLKTDFVSNVSHEMKTPIAVIQNSVQLLRSPSLSPGQRAEYEDDIENAARRLSSLTSNILRLNKLENKFITPQKNRFDICRQLADCVLEHERQWEQKDIAIDLDTEDRHIVSHDKEMLSLVWNNLISNAIKFTGSGGTIRITERPSPEQAGSVCITVSDTGCGMDAKTMSHIFDKFFQGDTSHAREGNGLGLALVRRVLELEGGTISVQSEEGKGSSFTVTLPDGDTDGN